MKFEMRLRTGDDVRAVWAFAVGILICGSFFVQTRYQTAINAAHDRTEKFYRQTVAEARIVREASILHAIQARALRDLARISDDSSLSAATANLLETLHRSANLFGTDVLELEPGASEPAASAGNAAAVATDALEATPITIRVRGKFRSILAFVEDLSHHAMLLRVYDTEMSRSNDSSRSDSEPTLDATVHATLYRLSPSTGKEVRVASAG